jgi:hypothetical protein
VICHGFADKADKIINFSKKALPGLSILIKKRYPSRNNVDLG